ncbi:MAG: DNA mismatch repair endonuclease MutL, partial [Gammaproteobacteria bacterium]
MAASTISRIHRLPETVINQIAAGEVIERPVSVVKELLENSLDAGARHLTIEVAGGGGRLIRVVDDGHGIHADDLGVAIDRHTTSKLSRPEDLARIGTLGFRGEALSSIAAVSRMTLISRQAGSEHGWKISLAADGSAHTIKPAPHPVGTTVEIRDLFYNTPARRKFLRSDHSEFLQIQELVKRIALSRVDLALRLVHNDRQVLQVSGAMMEPEARMQAVLGRHFSEHSVRILNRSGDYFLCGWLGLPEAARSRSDQQYFYLNGRIIRDKLLAHAVRLACQERLHPGRQPFCLLYLEMDAVLVDVNVHPSKHEVRFRDPRNVHDFIYGCLVQGLTGSRDDGPRAPASPAMRTTEYSTGRDRPMRMGETSAWYYPAAAPSMNLPQSPDDGARPLTLLHGRYIIAEDRHGLVLVDSLRARELVVHARLHAAFAAGD